MRLIGGILYFQSILLLIVVKLDGYQAVAGATAGRIHLRPFNRLNYRKSLWQWFRSDLCRDETGELSILKASRLLAVYGVCFICYYGT